MVGPENQLAEEGVGPGKPTTSELHRIVLVEGFVHEPGPAMGRLEHVETIGDLGVVIVEGNGRYSVHYEYVP